METVVLVAVCVLAVLFAGCFVGVIYLCYHRYHQRRHSLISNDTDSLNQNVLANDVNSVEANSSSLELESIVTCDDGTIRQLLETEEWAKDVHGVIPHCIAILKMCREVTVKLVKVAVENNYQNIHPSYLNEIAVVAKSITPRVDDVMRAISPPIDVKVLEARSAALIYSVQHLGMMLRNAWRSYNSLDWIDAAMDNLKEHMKVLQMATQEKVSVSTIQNNDTNEVDKNKSSELPIIDNKESSQL